MQVVKHKLHTVLILAETKEYEKFAGKDLEEFYRSLGLEVLHHPIADFSVPEQAGWACCEELKIAHVFHMYDVLHFRDIILQQILCWM